MSGHEFDIIHEFFSELTPARPDTLIGIGDDCAVLSPAAEQLLAVSTDTLVSGIHFLPDTPPESLGHKALAVNLSDLAAMGATPSWVTLALTLPEVDRDWLKAFTEGFGQLANQYAVQLIGGDLTRGPLSLTLTVHGQVEPPRLLTRAGARPGDRVFISGTPGKAAYALQCLLDGQAPADIEQSALEALHRPQPRLALGQALAGIATACIDISDGLLADLGHLCENSSCGASIEQHRIPLSPPITQHIGQRRALELALTGGDDYELCFTVPASACSQLQEIATQLDIELFDIGEINPGESPVCLDENGQPLLLNQNGFQHF